MSEDNKQNRNPSKPWCEDGEGRRNPSIKRDNQGRFLAGSVPNPTGIGGNKRTVDKEVRRIIQGKDTVYLENIYAASLQEINARNAALKVYTDLLVSYMDTIGEMMKRKGRMSTKKLEDLLERFEQLPEKITITLPNLQASSLFNAVLLKLLPTMQSIDAKVGFNQKIIAKILTHSGESRLDYIVRGRDAIIEAMGGFDDDDEGGG